MVNYIFYVAVSSIDNAEPTSQYYSKIYIMYVKTFSLKKWNSMPPVPLLCGPCICSHVYPSPLILTTDNKFLKFVNPPAHSDHPFMMGFRVSRIPSLSRHWWLGPSTFKLFRRLCFFRVAMTAKRRGYSQQMFHFKLFRMRNTLILSHFNYIIVMVVTQIYIFIYF